MPDASCRVVMVLQLWNPHRLRGHMLAGENAHAGRRLLARPLEHAEFRLGLSAARKVDRTPELDRTRGGNAARLQHGSACLGIVGPERGPFDALVPGEPRA